jgi:hypothetical protein
VFERGFLITLPNKNKAAVDPLMLIGEEEREIVEFIGRQKVATVEQVAACYIRFRNLRTGLGGFKARLFCRK